jgi:hypothetical protein
LLLDHDVLDRAPDRKDEIVKQAESRHIRLVWQRPCHEALLLTHIVGRGRRKPSTCKQAHRDLLKEWPSYEKGTPADMLLSKFGAEGLERAAVQHSELQAFLSAIGFH